MKRKTVIWIVITFCVLMLIIPFGINILFKHDFGIELFRAEWSAGDALVYCGTIISVFFAVGGVWLSIKENNKANKENIRISTLPFIGLKLVDPSTDLSDVGKEKVLKLYAGTLSWDSPANYELDIIKKEYLEEYKGEEYEGRGDRAIGWFILHNTGRGTALNISIALLRDGVPDNGTGRFHIADDLLQNAKLSVLFYSDKIQEEDVNCGDFTLVMEYYDIWGNKYRLTNGFSVLKENHKLYSMWGIDWLPEHVGNINDTNPNTIQN